MARSPQLGVAAVLPAVAQHAQQARNGFSRADALALLTSFLKKVRLLFPSNVCQHSFFVQIIH